VALLTVALLLTAQPLLAGVGFTWRAVADPVTADRVPIALWYPSATEGGETVIETIRFAATAEAPPAPARALVLISHGSAGGPLGYHDTAVALADAGYVVAAPAHARDNFRDFSGAGGRSVLAGRVQTLSAVIDAVARAGLVDTTHVGVVGHSAGGYTALAIAGAEASFAALRANCDRATSDLSCVFWPTFRTEAEGPAPIDAPPDPRIAAAVALTPLVSPFSDAALARLDLPLLVYQAEMDGLLTPPHHAARLRPYAAEYISVEGANHGVFLAEPPSGAVGLLPHLANPPGFDRAAFHTEMNARILAFFDAALPGD
jgi:predicted dienelactone hydrolase